jgi:hypothetical protein
MGLVLSEDLRVMVAPMAAYQRLVQTATDATVDAGVAVVVRRPALVALVIGCFITLATTGQLTAALVASTTLCWSFVPLVQLLAAAALITLGRRRSIRLASALDLFFMGHAPWSLFLLGLAGVVGAKLPLGTAALRAPGFVLLAAMVPLVWTWVITFAFCRRVLGLGAALAVAGTVAYQAAIWTVAYFYVAAVTYELPPFGRGS